MARTEYFQRSISRKSLEKSGLCGHHDLTQPVALKKGGGGGGGGRGEGGGLGGGGGGLLFGGGGGGGVFRLIAKFAVLLLGKKMMPAISMRMLHETSSTSHDLKSS